MVSDQTLTFIRTGVRCFFYISLFWIGEKFFGMQKCSIILCYHSIAEDSWFHAVTKKDFMEQVMLLKAKGYHFVSLTEVVKSIREKTALPEPFCVITFDDGYQDVLSVKDFLEQEKICPAVFVLAEPKSVAKEEIGTDRRFLSADEIQSLARLGWDIGCHSARHKNLAYADNASLQHEIIHAREILKKELNLPIDFFAYPFGAYVYQSVSFVKRGGYKAAFSMDDRISINAQSIWRLPRIGINRTYSIKEFEAAISPLNILFRKVVKLFL